MDLILLGEMTLSLACGPEFMAFKYKDQMRLWFYCDILVVPLGAPMLGGLMYIGPRTEASIRIGIVRLDPRNIDPRVLGIWLSVEDSRFSD